MQRRPEPGRSRARWLALLAALGCAPSPSDSAARPAESLAVDYGRCVAVVADEPPRCVLDGERIHLWVTDPEAERVELRLDGEPVQALPYHRPELIGLGLELSVPEAAAELQLTLGPTSRPHAAWTLQLVRGEPSPQIIATNLEIQDLVAAGRTEAALAELDALRQQHPRSTETLDAALAAAHVLIQRAHDPQQAQALLDDYAALADASPQGRALLATAWALLHWKQGRLDRAAMEYREAAQFALRTRDPGLELITLSMYAELLAELGYLRAAGHWARHVGRLLETQVFLPGHVASTQRTIAWIALQLREADEDALDPAVPLQRALALFEPGGQAADPYKVGGTRLGLARLALQQADPAGALDQLARIDPTKLTPDERTQALDLEIRARVQSGASPETLVPLLDRLEAAVDETATPQARWQLAFLRGRVAELGGDRATAIERYGQAETLHDHAARLAVFGVGRSRLGALGREATRRRVALLVESGRRSEALCAVRLARARALQTLVLPQTLSGEQRTAIEAQVQRYLRLEQQVDALERSGADEPGEALARVRREASALRDALAQDATELMLARGHLETHLRCEDLVPREPGELLLAPFPADDRWIVLVEDDEGITAHAVMGSARPSTRSPDALARQWLDPVHDRIGRARRIRVLPTGDALEVDVHALPFDGAPLIAHAAVRYGAELPAQALPVHDGPRTALLLADTTDTLWSPSPEVLDVERRLRDAGWSTRVPFETGSLPQVLGDLGRADLFHYAGHADAATSEDPAGHWPPYAGGAPGWPSYLPLQPPTRLAAHHVLMASRSPRWVVLGGCRTGVTDVQHAGTSLALAFLAAGSEQVLAAPDATDDRLTAEIDRALYDALEPDRPLDLAEQLHRVLRSRALAGEPLGRMRVWVR